MKLKFATATAVILLAAGCQSSTEPFAASNVAVAFSTRPAGGSQAVSFPFSASRAALVSDTTVTGTDTLILNSVQVVLRNVELKRLNAQNCNERDSCEKFEAGPVLVSLPLTPGVSQQFSLDIPPDTYSEIEFEIHKPSGDDAADSQFVQAHPTFADISIRATGFFNGTAFTFESDLDVEQELSLVPPLAISDSAMSTTLTIFVDVGTWFRGLSGQLLDPDSGNKGGNNENRIEDNIKNSFEAFEDEDRDGVDD